MTRPTTKEEILTQSRAQHDALENLICSLCREEIIQPGAVGDWSVKDVLAHLTTWEQMALGWYRAGQRGEMPSLPAPGYQWNETAALNRKIYEKHQHRSLDAVLADFRSSYTEIMALILSLSEEDLFTPGHCQWTHQNDLATYLIAATYTHYRWARMEIRQGMRVKAAA